LSENLFIIDSLLFFILSYILEEILPKFQIRIIFFNIFFVFFLFVAVFFVAFLGKSQMSELTWLFWPLGIAMILSLSIMNVVYFLNRKLLTLLEQENWPALTAYLEQKVYKEGRYKPRYIKLLAQSCLAAGNFDGVENLKNRLAAAKPALVEDNALVLGTACLLGGNTAAAVEFFQERLEKGKSKKMNWLRWYYGFSLMLTGAYEKAGAVFGELAASMPAAGADDVLVTALAAFVLTELAGKNPKAAAEWRVCAEEGKSRARKTLKTAGKWTKKAEQLKTEVYGAVIRSYVDRTGAWIWGR
jgi:hypothetical protein